MIFFKIGLMLKYEVLKCLKKVKQQKQKKNFSFSLNLIFFVMHFKSFLLICITFSFGNQLQ